MHNAAWPLCASADTYRDPQARWDDTGRYVETIRDALGKPVDAGIKSLVIALNANGFPTTASCEGHPNWGVPAPWVDVGPAPTHESVVLRRELVAFAEEIETIGCDHLDASVIEALAKKRRNLEIEVRRPTLALARNLMTFFDAFYRDRRVPYDQTISLHLRLIGFRMQCHGTALQDIAIPAEKITNLQRYQGEMHTFAAFLATHYQQRFGQ